MRRANLHGGSHSRVEGSRNREGAAIIAVKARKVGEGLGVELPRAALDRLKAEEGATLVLSEAADGWHLASANPEFDRQMALAEEDMARYRNTLRDLAK